MKSKVIFLAVLMLVVVALAALSPAAFAGRVTRIMYAQENVDAYMYKATTAGDLTVTCTWYEADGTTLAPVWPEGSVNVAVQTVDVLDPVQTWSDLNIEDLYAPYTNPVTNGTTPTVISLEAGQEVWVVVNPYVGDWKYSLRVQYTGTGQWHGQDDALATPETTSDKTVSGNAYASDGEVWVGNTGVWYGVGQFWGQNSDTPGVALTNWNLYVASRDYDYTSGFWPEWTYPYSWYPDTAQLYTGNGAPDGSDMNTANMTASQVGRWFGVQPQVWGGAAVPNVWPAAPPIDATAFQYPKPGSITFDRAPLWYTYSFVDANFQTKPGYTWGALTPGGVSDWFSTTAAPSKRSYSSNAAAASTISWRFQGDDFTWVYEKGYKGGIQKVMVDGKAGTTAKSTVNQFNATLQYQQSTTYNLQTDFGITSTGATGWHTVTITGTGNSDSTATPKQYFIYHDCFIDPDDLTPKAENNYDGQTSYTWDLVTPSPTPAGLSGTSYTSTKDGSGGLAYTFECAQNQAANRRFQWTYLTGAKGGIQNVYLDGKLIDKVNQFSSLVAYGVTKTYTDGVATAYGVTVSLPKGWHTVFITGSGASDSTSTPKQFFIYHDAFQVEGGAVIQE